ncbi:hypothetical protein CPLU01_14822 [Colletotrichum plurivorum]|uniref:Uncharacterized protein n=1 Tax=Colletotrichum plurivorum TaxID=2175906 RepID=A0A8H6MYB3_9PEZI|nr:hypothetical protein CPLU01_14822 [Colletotrichum plurivorum]
MHFRSFNGLATNTSGLILFALFRTRRTIGKRSRI